MLHKIKGAKTPRKLAYFYSALTVSAVVPKRKVLW